MNIKMCFIQEVKFLQEATGIAEQLTAAWLTTAFTGLAAWSSRMSENSADIKQPL